MRMRSGGLLIAVSARRIRTAPVRTSIHQQRNIQESYTDRSLIVLESYITHIRIIEDATYPSTPPPPNSSPEVKKPRLIIVAVRKSGRVRLHKARENVNGTFSIGKTWPLDDLTAVESFNGATPKNAEEEQRKLWAGPVGFIVTLGKPYYWQAVTQKEKQFFVASLVKIFVKYTGGRSPELVGFDEKEREQLLGPASSQAQQPVSQRTTSPAPVQPILPISPPPYSQIQPRGPRITPSPESGHQQQGSRERLLNQQVSPDPTLRQQGLVPNARTSLTSQTSRPNMPIKREESPSSSIDFNGVTPQESQASLRKVANSNQSQDSFASSYDANSLPPRSRGGLNGLPNAVGRFPDTSALPNSFRGSPADNSYARTKEVPNDAVPIPAPLTFPPERRRPPLQSSSDGNHSRGHSDENMVPAPLNSHSTQRDNSGSPLPARKSEAVRSSLTENRVKEVLTQDGRNGSSTQIISQPTTQTSDLTSEVGRSMSTENATTISTSSSITQPSEELPSEPKEDERPGLGPMIKKKSRADVANAFRKAATAANAFKPRAGGAAERLREQQSKPSDGPDGITEVVPAPSLVRTVSNNTTRIATPDLAANDKVVTPVVNDPIPVVKITVPQSDRPSSVEGPIQTPAEVAVSEKAKNRDVRRQKPTSEMTQKHLASLGIDASILDGRGAEFAALLDDFGWAGEGIHAKNIDQMQDELERELNRTQAGGWLSRLDEEDERVEAIKNGLDMCIAECEELDGLLTLYGVELGVSNYTFGIFMILTFSQTLNEDIAYIEAQSQGLQVQTSNQKLLKAELQSLLETISISSSQLQSLREASIESTRGLEQIETSLVLLFKAMVTIDPALGATTARTSEEGSLPSGKPGGFGTSEISSMRVLQEKKDIYRTECMMFLRRLRPFLQVKFGAAIDETKKVLERERVSTLTRRTATSKLDPRHHDLARNVLWRYSPLVLFAREVDRAEWEEIMRSYEIVTKPIYREEFGDARSAWQRNARKPTGDENEILFTSQIEKQTEGLATTARKLTVKRSQTLAKSLRSPISENSSKSSIDKIQDGRINPYEVVGGILDEAIPLIIMEQNFVVEFFHVSSFDLQDFPESVNSATPEMRHGNELRKPKPMDPNRDLAKKVIQSMEELYSFFPSEIENLVNWAIATDSLQVLLFGLFESNANNIIRQGVGVLAVLERKLLDIEESNQEYLAHVLQKEHSRLSGLFTKFLDGQIRAIEDTKVKIKKRRGVIGFVRIFPVFSAAIETMLAGADDLSIRETVNNAYIRINKTMFESLKVIARENPNAASSGATIGDPEDKEALNYQILLIENMNHYIEEVETKGNPVLEEWKEKAGQELDEHLSLYLNAVMTRPLGKLMSYIESVESQINSLQPGTAPSAIANINSHRKSVFKTRLEGYDSKDIRAGIVTLKRRVEKHFGDADDPGLSRGLVAKVLDACEKFYENIEEKVRNISSDVYGGDLGVLWTKADVASSFKK